MLSPILVSSGQRPEGGLMPAKATQQPDDLSNPYGYSAMDWAAQLDPAYAAARAAVRRLSMGEARARSVTVKECVVLGIFASRGLQYGVEAPHAPCPRARGHQGRGMRSHQSGGCPRRRGGL